jgi:transposase-like protein
MSTFYSQSFKDKVVEKALNRDSGATIDAIVNEHGISRSSMNRWIKAAQQADEPNIMEPEKKEKRPQDWCRDERLQAIIDCGGFDEQAISAYCRKRGLYAHHITRWKKEFLSTESSAVNASTQAQLKQLKSDNKQLQQELRRKEKALAEAAALLVLKKKAQHLWVNGEDS